MIAKKYLVAGAASLLIVGVAVQSFGKAQAEKYGYLQSDCPTIVKQALDTVSSECSKMGRNKVCYGNSSILATFEPGAGQMTFQSPGDLADITQIKALMLGDVDPATNTWGVAEMRVQADLPDSDPNQNVTFIMFGQGSLSANGIPGLASTSIPPTPTASSRQQTQVAAATAHQATQLAATATSLAGVIDTATAKASTPTPTGTIPAFRQTQAAATATKLANLINTATAAPISATPKASPSPASSGVTTGAQAFYFASGENVSCEQAPHDGILIQAPQGGKQRVTLTIDGTTIALGSTVFIQAQPGKTLSVNTLEGLAAVTAQGQTQYATPGTVVTVPLGANWQPSGPPTVSQFYLADTVRALPISLLPGTPITAAPGLPPGITFTTWTGLDTVTYTGAACTELKTPPPFPQTTQLALDSTQNNLWLQRDPTHILPPVAVLLNGSANSYTGTFFTSDSTNVYVNNLSAIFSDSTHVVIQLSYNSGGCLNTLTAALTLSAQPPFTLTPPPPAHP